MNYKMIDLDERENVRKMYEAIRNTDPAATVMLEAALRNERLDAAFNDPKGISSWSYVKLHESVLHWYEKICEKKKAFPEIKNYII